MHSQSLAYEICNNMYNVHLSTPLPSPTTYMYATVWPLQWCLLAVSPARTGPGQCAQAVGGGVVPAEADRCHCQLVAGVRSELGQCHQRGRGMDRGGCRQRAGWVLGSVTWRTEHTEHRGGAPRAPRDREHRGSRQTATTARHARCMYHAPQSSCTVPARNPLNRTITPHTARHIPPATNHIPHGIHRTLTTQKTTHRE